MAQPRLKPRASLSVTSLNTPQNVSLSLLTKQLKQETKEESSQQIYETEDLSSRAAFFRNKLIDEFRIFENEEYTGLGLGFQNAPQYSTADLFSSPDVDLFKNIIRNQPDQLINFKIFKRRTQQDNHIYPRLQFLSHRHLSIRQFIQLYSHFIVQSPLFNQYILFLIILNAIIAGIQIDINVNQYPLLYDILDLMDDLILIFFSIEIALKWCDDFFNYWKDGWNIFDFCVTIPLSVIPRLLSVIIQSEPGFASIAVQLRIFRILRTLKMIGRFKSLRLVIQTIIGAFQSLGFVLVLLFMIFYIFSIFALTLFEPYTLSTQKDLLFQNKWSNLSQSFISLFQLLTLDQWYRIQDDMQKSLPSIIVVLFFVVWVWLGAFIFRNIFVGIMVKKFDEMSIKFAEDSRKEKGKKEVIALQKDFKTKESQLSPIYEDKELTLDNMDGLNEKKDIDIPQDKNEIEKWHHRVHSVINSLKNQNIEYFWPRDTLFHYLQNMELLQENLKEYEDLTFLSATALSNLFDS